MEAKTTHTPGPWTYRTEGQRHIIFIERPIGEAALAAVCMTAGAHHDSVANAALIAASPELYEALKAAVEIIDQWIEPETMGVVRSGDGVLGHYLRDEYLMRFRAALSRVEQTGKRDEVGNDAS